MYFEQVVARSVLIHTIKVCTVHGRYIVLPLQSANLSMLNDGSFVRRAVDRASSFSIYGTGTIIHRSGWQEEARGQPDMEHINSQ